MTPLMIEIVGDALLSYLETGFRPPKMFSVRLPSAAFLKNVKRYPVDIAGYSIECIADDTYKD